MTLQVEELGIGLAARANVRTDGGPIVDDMAFELPDGATLGVVGESGSGKSLLALAIIGLLPRGIAAAGRVLLDGIDLLSLPEDDLCHIRGARIGMIFQEPMTALNPAMRIGDQIAEGLAWHRGTGRAAAWAEALRLLDRVRIPDARHRLQAYPHELSGGQRQRVGIAIALAPGPKLLIADEPTTALDVTVQAEILDLLDELVDELGMSLIIISHDLGVIARMADRTLVMYAGTRVEEGPTEVVLNQPLHPYTSALLAAMPRRLAAADRSDRRALRLASIPGSVPRAGQLPPGCRFTPRCPMAIADCAAAEPAWRAIRPAHAARCIRAEELT
jgi:peptide/nickel transport system ATP-binding protein